MHRKIVERTPNKTRFSHDQILHLDPYDHYILKDRNIEEYESENSCAPSSECVLCPETHFIELDECKLTHRRQVFTCFISRDGNLSGEYRLYKSCNRTKLDEQYIIIHIQILCLLLVLFFMIPFRRKKTLNASSFDHRNIKDISDDESPSEFNDIVSLLILRSSFISIRRLTMFKILI